MRNWRMVARPARSRAGGYSLIEIGIVLVAISLTVTGAIWAFDNQWRQDAHNETKAYMDTARIAVLSYASTTRTAGSRVTFGSIGGVGPNNGAPVAVRVPAGRPLLPCPDVDGDGIEDRTAPVAAAEVTVAYYSSRPNRPALVNLDEIPGRCLDVKGLLPWRTLGTRPYDRWGNVYGYYVDPNFTDGLFGFDQTTRGSVIFKHLAMPLAAGGYAYAVRAHYGTSSPYGSFRGGYARRASSNAFPSRAAFPHNGVVLANHVARPSSDFNQGNDDALDAGQLVIAGNVYAADPLRYREYVELRNVNRRTGLEVPVYEYRGVRYHDDPLDFLTFQTKTPIMADGIAFAIISHGHNGWGANKYEESDPLGMNCAWFEHRDEERHRAEVLNALRSHDCAETDRIPSSCSVQAYVRACGDHRISTGRLFSNRRSFHRIVNNEYIDIDDIVSWMMPAELVAELGDAGVLPQPVPPVAVPANMQPFDHVAYPTY